MDVVSGISLAASIVSLVDFGFKLSLNTSELSRSANGSLDANNELEKITSRVYRLSEAIEADASGDPSLGTANGSKYLADVQSLTEMSKEVSAQLISHLQHLKVRGDRHWRNTLSATFRNLQWGGRTETLEKRLHRLQEYVRTFLTADTWDTQKTLLSLTQASADRGQKQMEDLRHEILKALDPSRLHVHLPGPYGELSLVLERLAQDSKDAAVRSVLQSLAFDQMSARRSRVSEAHAKTFEWIFDSPQIRFKEFLESELTNNMYWISGKPGSGKSTLLKFLYKHKRSLEALSTWAGSEKQLIIGSHFFWASGTEKQKSQEGLIRSILHDILSQCPSWIPVICPPHIQKRFDYGDRDPWSYGDLVETFRKVLRPEVLHDTGILFGSTRICLFIDGLDEYKGDEADLIKLLRQSEGSTYVKICVSSREGPKFDDAFRGDGKQMLKLQDLTRSDIEKYVQETLRNNPWISNWKDYDVREFFSLVDEIVAKAKGVFLWVALVVRSLLAGLSQEDSIRDLRRQLDMLPDELIPYFTHVLDGIEKKYQAESAQVLKTVLYAKSPLHLVTIQHAIDSPKLAYYRLGSPEEMLSNEGTTRLIQKSRKRLYARCKDFLEVELSWRGEKFSRYEHKDKESLVNCQYQVGLVHRSVRDFLHLPRVEAKLESWIPSTFSPSVCVSTCWMSLMILLPSSFFQDFYDQGPSAKFTSNNRHLQSWPIEKMVGHLKESYEQNKETSFQLIEKFLNIMDTRRKEAGPLNWNWITTPSGRRETQDDVLVWALASGLTTFVCEKIRRDSGSVTEQNCVLLMEKACDVSAYFEVPETDPTGIIGEVLNLVTETGSRLECCQSELHLLWVGIVASFLKNIRRGDRWGKETGKLLLPMIEVWLRYGADPGPTLLTPSRLLKESEKRIEDIPQTSMTALNAVEAGLFPEDVARLKECIQAAQESDPPRRIRP